MKNKKKKESHLRIIKETYGDIPIEEAFRKAFEPYFKPDKEKVSVS